MTRDDYLALWPRLSTPDGDPYGDFRRWANEGFDAFAPGGADHVDPEIVDADIEMVKQATAKVSRWADENVAHLGRKKSVDVTYDELDTAIASLGELLQRYYKLFTASHLAFVTPAIQEDWKSPFREAWDV